MKVLCTMKRVVDPDVKVKLNGDGRLDMSNVEYKGNPFDEYGVEEAVRLKEKGHATEIVVVSVGPSEAEQQIRTALAMGADRGILVKVDDDQEIDTLTVARLLAAVVEKEEPDIVLMGKLSVDSEGNQVGQMVAELAGMGQGTFAYQLDVEDGVAVVGREVDGGTASVRVQLPAVITADLRLNEPRYASLPGIMKARKKPLEVIDADDLDVDLDPQIITIGYELPPERTSGEMVDSVDALLDKLRNVAKVL
jgi:electron transfer flavoprotein beta subunit